MSNNNDVDVATLLNSASIASDTEKIDLLASAFELMSHRDTALLNEYYTSLIQFALDSTVQIKKQIIGFIELTCKSKPQCNVSISKDILKYLLGQSPQVIKRTILCFTNLVRSLLSYTLTSNNNDVGDVWSSFNELRRYILDPSCSILSISDSTMAHSFKLLEILILCYSVSNEAMGSSGTSSSTVVQRRYRSDEEFSLDRVPPVHNLLNRQQLQKDCTSYLNTLLDHIVSLDSMLKNTLVSPFVQDLSRALSSIDVSPKEIDEASRWYRGEPEKKKRLNEQPDINNMKKLKSEQQQQQQIQQQQTQQQQQQHLLQQQQQQQQFQQFQQNNNGYINNNNNRIPSPIIYKPGIHLDNETQLKVISSLESLRPDFVADLIIENMNISPFFSLLQNIQHNQNTDKLFQFVNSYQQPIQSLSSPPPSSTSYPYPPNNNNMLTSPPTPIIPPPTFKSATTNDPRRKSESPPLPIGMIDNNSVGSAISSIGIPNAAMTMPMDTSQPSTSTTLLSPTAKPIDVYEEEQEQEEPELDKLLESEELLDQDKEQDANAGIGAVSKPDNDNPDGLDSNEMRGVTSTSTTSTTTTTASTTTASTSDITQGFSINPTFKIPTLNTDQINNIIDRSMQRLKHSEKGAIQGGKKLLWSSLFARLLSVNERKESNANHLLQNQMIEYILEEFCLFNHAVDPNEFIRANTVRVLSEELFKFASLSQKIELFVIDQLLSVLPQPDDQSMNQDKPTINNKLQLFFSICAKKPSLLTEVIECYPRCTDAVKDMIVEMIGPVVSSIGQANESLLQIIQVCPVGSEKLVYQIIDSLSTSKATTTTTTSDSEVSTTTAAAEQPLLSKEFVQSVRTLSKSTKDVKFLLPVVNGLDKSEIIEMLPTFVMPPSDIANDSNDRYLHQEYRCFPTGDTGRNHSTAYSSTYAAQDTDENNASGTPEIPASQTVHCRYASLSTANNNN
ncbi:symplekin [Heterostelium album PN500]|uniref:Symplekin n=1 Tax=Heterostelium pallidum (strain ATCC 26659 / Pp 5 / PN500) TaxID=670386 RepID=D3B4Y0_HETP5|nr:symplekin [Heterostelium album PN500]EFA84378.1 symplekin [Heterostelium album PN500]|eukprot:XP_020436493.1 symplekin [Heterostelium album PN500]